MMLSTLLCMAAPCLPDGMLDAEYWTRVLPGPEPVVEVEVLLTELHGPVELMLPQGTTYARLPEPRLAVPPHPLRVAADDRDTALLERLGPYRWRLDPQGASAARLGWSVPFDHRQQAGVVGRDEYEFPYLEREHALLSASTLFLAPDDLCAIRVHFELPAGWPLHAPWPRGAGDVFLPPNIGCLQDDYIAVGAWEVEQRRIEELDLTLAFAPGQSALRERALPRITPIIEAELELFGCTPQRRYLFVFGRPDGRGFGGSPKSSSMTLYVDPLLPAADAIEGLTHLIAHEFHHTWGRARTSFPDELRFFAEGFTDYYAWRLPWQLGLRDDATALAELARDLATHASSQARCGQSLVEAGGPAFFQGGDAYQTIYQGGKAIALYLDLALGTDAEGERGLDQLMRRFMEDPRWRDGTQPTLEDFLMRVELELDVARADRLQQWLLAGEVFDVAAALQEFELEVMREEQPVQPTPGANFDGTRITALDPSLCASLLGLRIGDQLIEINGEPVVDEAELRRAWRPNDEHGIDLWLLREGEELNLVQPWPSTTRLLLPTTLLTRLR